MNNYIQIYKDVLDPSYCKDLIHRFEKNTEHYETHEQGPMSFTQVNLNKSQWQDDISNLSSVFTKYLQQYKNDCVITNHMWPDKYAFEEIRLKRQWKIGKANFGDKWDEMSEIL